MNIFSWLKTRYTWRWIGTVEGPTFYLDSNGDRKPGGSGHCYWNLYERGDGKRDYAQIGTNHGSALALQREAEVRAWYRGGPLPTLSNQAEPTKPKGKATLLVVFPGGKGAR